MNQLTERDIRASFVNCTKGEAQRLAVPRDLAVRPWDDLDFLGWTDPASPERAYVVMPSSERLIGVVLRRATPGVGQMRRSLCSICLTTHTGDGVALMTARKAGREGLQGNSVGIYFCADLACSLYLRGKKETVTRFHESLMVEEKVARAMDNLAGFVGKVVGD